MLREQLLRVSQVFPEISTGDIAHYPQAFSSFPEKRAKKPSVVTGHFCYGLHQSFDTPPKYFSIVRDPVSRLKSYYNYILNSESYFVRDFVEQNNLAFADLARFGDGVMIGNYPKEFDIMIENGQTRQIAGVTDTLARPVETSLHAQALDNIAEGYLFLAPTEKVTEAIIAVSLYLGIRPSMRYQRINVAPTDHVGPIPETLAGYIRARNHFDMDLAARASQSFADYVRPMQRRLKHSKRFIEVTGYGYRLAKKAGL